MKQTTMKQTTMKQTTMKQTTTKKSYLDLDSVNPNIPNRTEILSRFSHAQELDFGGNIWNRTVPIDPSNKTSNPSALANAYLDAWVLFWDALSQADIHSLDDLNDDEIGWQAYNWASDAVIALMNAKMWEDCIKLNQWILDFGWRNEDENFKELSTGNIKRSARRDIAECYAMMGDVDKSEEMFQQYLTADPYWGWGWIGYFLMLEKNRPEKLGEACTFALLDDSTLPSTDSTEKSRTLLYCAKLFIENNPVVMDECMLEQMAEIYRKHGTPEDAEFFEDVSKSIKE